MEHFKVMFRPTAFLFSLFFTVVISALNPIRLAGNSDTRGRLEYLYRGQWGTVCDNHFDMLDATVVCRELNLGNAVKVLTGVGGARDSSPIWLDDVECTGKEQHLSACPSTSQHSCTHDEDVGVECTGDTHPVRLDGSSIAHEGLVEIEHDGVWGTVCEDNWSQDNTDVVCKQLGFEGGNYFTATDYTDSNSIVLDDVACVGTELTLAQCSHSNWGEHNCNNIEKIWVSCLTDKSDSISVRLVGGETANEGILEVKMNSRWGTVCRVNWGLEQSDVVCRQLGYGVGVKVYTQSRYLYQLGNTESHPINIFSADCGQGLSSNLKSCELTTENLWGCDHQSDVVLSCYNIFSEDGPLTGDARLVDGIDDSEGIFEIFLDGRWGTICDWNWYQEEGDVACKQLGYDLASSYSIDIHVDEASKMQVHPYAFDCYSGTENQLIECSQTYFGSCDAYGNNIVALSCTYNSIDVEIWVIISIIFIIIIVICCCGMRRQRMNAASRTTTTSIPLATNQPVQVHPPVQQPFLLQTGQPDPLQPGYPYEHGPPQLPPAYSVQPTDPLPPSYESVVQNPNKYPQI
ncbi:neurotrypsin-like isoform X2 [Anneissia japonica]|uniref:neurotrypsin-like isoform X2 n=1 Tax=Anneissia japonica TaxID=1529436 RepID=UPI00142585EB|nr:neurotrypsin-like isoform X2 [Anneissia japonica]